MSDYENRKVQGFNFDLQALLWLNLEQIWPDGDAPENPTAADVAKVIEQCGGLATVIREWGLEDELTLTISHGKDYVEIGQ